MSPVISRAELEWEEWDRGRFRQRHAPLGDRVGAVKLGYNLQETAPGRASVPYHAHRVNEELIVHLEGEAWVRLDGAEHRLAPGTVVALPAGPDSAHQIVNRSDRPVLSLLASTRLPWDWIDYPDSEKNMVRVEALAGDTPAIRRMLRGERAVEITPEGYLEGEPVDEPLGPPPAGEAPRDPRIVAFEEVEWQANEWGPFRSERRRLAWVAGARRLGFGLWRLAPGERLAPYHFHHVNEEAFLVLEGRAVLRTPEGEREVAAGDVVGCPAGPAGAHAFRGAGEGPCVLLALSTMESPEVMEYPDSDKLYVMVVSPPGGDAALRSLDAVFRRSDAVEYLEGES